MTNAEYYKTRNEATIEYLKNHGGVFYTDYQQNINVYDSKFVDWLFEEHIENPKEAWNKIMDENRKLSDEIESLKKDIIELAEENQRHIEEIRTYRKMFDKKDEDDKNDVKWVSPQPDCKDIKEMIRDFGKSIHRMFGSLGQNTVK